MQYFTDKELDRLAGKLGQKLMQEPKVRLMIAGSMEDMPWEGGINGYFFRIQRGGRVRAPEPGGTDPAKRPGAAAGRGQRPAL